MGASESLYSLIEKGDAAKLRHNIEAVRRHINEPMEETLLHDTPLIQAAARNSRDIVELLINHKADLNLGNEMRQTPLHLAAAMDLVDVVRLLLNAGANVEATDKDGMTPLSAAARTGSVKCLAVLLDAGANIDAKDTLFGDTPFLKAAYNEQADAVKLLVARGANVGAKTYKELDYKAVCGGAAAVLEAVEAGLQERAKLASAPRSDSKTSPPLVTPLLSPAAIYTPPNTPATFEEQASAQPSPQARAEAEADLSSRADRD